MTLTPAKTARAFTLIETVIVVTISAIMFTTISVLIYDLNKTSEYQQTVLQSSGSASALVKEIESLALPADAVLQTHTFSGITRTSTSTTLVLEIPSIDSSGNIVPSAHDYAAFYTAGTDAYRILEANASSQRVSGTKKLSSTVNSLTFSYNNTDFSQVDTVIVDAQMRAQVKQELIYDHRQQQIRLRNH
ncbi:MAG: hypothetical protein Q7T37_01260 [bacterium]|nr:hypothetical protein [bacterium]MDO8742261.1 hypothetical protein [bacterium]